MALLDNKDFHFRFAEQTAWNQTATSPPGTANIQVFPNFPISYEVKADLARNVPITSFGKFQPSNYIQSRPTTSGSYSYYLGIEDGLEYNINKFYFTTVGTGSSFSGGGQTLKPKFFLGPFIHPTYGWTGNVHFKKSTTANILHQRDMFMTSRVYQFDEDSPLVPVTTNWIGGEETQLNEASGVTGSQSSGRELANRLNSILYIKTGEQASVGTADKVQFKTMTYEENTGLEFTYGSSKYPVGIVSNAANNTKRATFTKDLEPADPIWTLAKNDTVVTMVISCAFSINTSKFQFFRFERARLSGAPVLGSSNPTTVEYTVTPEAIVTATDDHGTWITDTQEDPS